MAVSRCLPNQSENKKRRGRNSFRLFSAMLEGKETGFSRPAVHWDKYLRK